MDFVRAAYDTDLSDQQWAQMVGFIPLAKIGGRPCTTALHDLGRSFALLEKQAPRWAAAYHPATAERRARTTGSADGAPPLTDDEWIAVRRICAK